MKAEKRKVQTTKDVPEFLVIQQDFPHQPFLLAASLAKVTAQMKKEIAPSRPPLPIIPLLLCSVANAARFSSFLTKLVAHTVSEFLHFVRNCAAGLFAACRRQQHTDANSNAYAN